MHNFYSNRAYMHGYCSTCINILIIFSLSLSLLLSPHSPFRLTLRDQHHTTTAWRTRSINTPLPPINITPLSSINIKPHAAWSNRRRSLSPHSLFFSFDQYQTIATDQLADQYQTIAAQSLIKSLLVNSLISWCLISGFRVGWVMIWLLDWVGFGLNGFLILGWFDLEWFSDLGLVWSWVVRRVGSDDDGG